MPPDAVMMVPRICADCMQLLQSVSHGKQAAFELAPDGQLADAAAALSEVDMDEREASGQAVALHLDATGGCAPGGGDSGAVGSKRRRTDKEGRPSELHLTSAAADVLMRPPHSHSECAVLDHRWLTPGGFASRPSPFNHPCIEAAEGGSHLAADS